MNVVSKNTKRMKVAFIVGAPVMLIVGIFFLYLAYGSLLNEEYISFFWLVLSAFFLNAARIGFTLLGNINIEIEMDSEGLLISSKKTHRRRYMWHEISRINESRIWQVLEAYDYRHNRIFMVDFVIPNYLFLRNTLLKKTADH